MVRGGRIPEWPVEERPCERLYHQGAGAIDENPVRWAEQILRLERARGLLLG